MFCKRIFILNSKHYLKPKKDVEGSYFFLNIIRYLYK